MKKMLITICIMSMLTLGATGCGCSKTEEEIATQPSTQAPTEQETQSVTNVPTQAPTQETTTEEPTQLEEPQEPGTFSIIIEEPITSPPPTEVPTETFTEIQTEISTQVSTETPTERTTQNMENEAVVGSWVLSYYERSNGQHTTPARVITYTFNPDGTFTVDSGGNEMTGRYSFNGEILSYVADANGEIGNFDFDEELDQLTDTDEGSNTVAVFIRAD